MAEMKKGLVELVFILDRSGSMSGLEGDTIGGYNSMLEKQRQESGEAVVTTVLFDHENELLHDRIPIRGIRPVTSKEYYVRGNTALLDAIGKSIQKIDNAVRNTLAEERPEKVLFIITTDGMENASREFDYNRVRQLVEHQKCMGWEFIFLGANMDAFSLAARVGIEKDRVANYHADSRGTQLNYEILSEAVSYMRANHSLDKSWKDEIDRDYADRVTE
jgi:uncharacterized protein YegL